MASLKIETFDSIQQIDATAWDQLSAGSPFQSYRWYVFGEQVMSDSPPIYILAYQGQTLVGRASFWLVRNEPLPRMPACVRKLLIAVLKRWPLLICRSPLSNSTGLILSESAPRKEVYSAIAQAALRVSQRRRASFILLDHLTEDETRGWPAVMTVSQISGPGTIMQSHWESLDAFLEAGNKKDRQHYKRTLRDAGKLGITISQHSSVTNLDQALALIGNVNRRYNNVPNPWMRSLLQNFEQVQGTWLEAHIEDRLVGGGLLLEDNGGQITTALALENDIPYVYFILAYESLDVAFKKRVQLLRWGSGAYEVKKHFGFELEYNNYLVFAAANPFIQLVGQWLRKTF